MAPKQSGGDGQWLGRHRLSLLELCLIQSFLVFQIIVFFQIGQIIQQKCQCFNMLSPRDDALRAGATWEPADTNR